MKLQHNEWGDDEVDLDAEMAEAEEEAIQNHVRNLDPAWLIWALFAAFALFALWYWPHLGAG